MKAVLRKKYNSQQQDCGKMVYRYEYFVFKINHVIMFCSVNRIINRGSFLVYFYLSLLKVLQYKYTKTMTLQLSLIMKWKKW